VFTVAAVSITPRVLLLAAAATLWAGCSSSSHKAATSPTTSPQSTQNAPTGASTCGGLGGTNNTGPESTPPGDIPDTQAFVTFPRGGDGYSVSVPEGWARSEQPGTVTFTDKFNSIKIDTTAAAAAPTPASAQTELSALAGKVQCLQPGAISGATRKAGPVVVVKYRADSPPDPVTGKVVHEDVERYEYWKAGKQVTLTLASPAGSDNVDPWRKVTDSFAWTA
jgi:hypothetical protein